MGTFQPIIVRLDETLELAGDTTCLADHIDVDSYTLGEHEFRLTDGVDYDLVLTNAGEGILVTGMLRAHVVVECDRCLEPAEFDVAGEVDEYYLFHEPETEPDDDDEEEGVDYSLVSDEHTIDVAEALEVPVDNLMPERVRVHATSEADEISRIFSKLNPENRETLLKMARMMELTESMKAAM